MDTCSRRLGDGGSFARRTAIGCLSVRCPSKLLLWWLTSSVSETFRS